MNIKRLLIALSALGFAFAVSAATTGAEAKMMMKKTSHGKMIMKKKHM